MSLSRSDVRRPPGAPDLAAPHPDAPHPDAPRPDAPRLAAPRPDAPGPHAPSPDKVTRFAVVGNPENRRTTMFADAVRAAGHPAPRVLAWRDVLSGRYAFAEGERVRIDSPGENAEVDRLLRDTDDPTRVEGTALWYRRFTAAVRDVTEAARRAGAVPSTGPEDVAVMFDKRRCHARLTAAGVPVPPALTGPVGGWEELRRLMADARMSRVFVKPAHGSSASGVVALATAGPGRVKATTSVETAPDGRLFNSLRVRHYTSERAVGALVDALAPDGLHVERWWPKAAQDGRAADLRVVVIAGRATHAVVRTSRHPMTNLHLGGVRGDLDAARDAIRAAGGRFADVLETAERAAACFPDTDCVGVDVLPATGWRRLAVGEVNAFGDLLPRLTGLPGSGAEGLDTYAAQVAAVRQDRTPDERTPNEQTYSTRTYSPRTYGPPGEAADVRRARRGRREEHHHDATG